MEKPTFKLQNSTPAYQIYDTHNTKIMDNNSAYKLQESNPFVQLDVDNKTAYKIQDDNGELYLMTSMSAAEKPR